MDEESKKLKNLRKDRERELHTRHTRELEEFDAVQDGSIPSSGPWKHRTSSQRSGTSPKSVENNGTAMSANGRKSMSPTTGSPAR